MSYTRLQKCKHKQVPVCNKSQTALRPGSATGMEWKLALMVVYKFWGH